MKMILCPAVEPARLAQIEAAAGPMRVLNLPDETAALPEMPDADAFFGKLTPPLLAAAGRLRWVQTPTASLEHYLFPELVAHRCTLTNMRGLFSDVVADHVFAYILCFARNFHRYIRQQTLAHWEPVGGELERANFIVGPGTVSAIDRAHLHLADATLGIVGFGAIGREVARRGQAFGMRVAAVDPLPQAAVPGVEAVWAPDKLPMLLTISDFVVISAPHTPDTARMFGREQFRQMKRSAWLINVGRGAIVDLHALCESLAAGEIAGAGLDVFETEPLPPDHPLWRCDNAIITPHVAGCSPRIAERHQGVLLRNIGRFVRGEPLENVADKTRWF